MLPGIINNKLIGWFLIEVGKGVDRPVLTGHAIWQRLPLKKHSNCKSLTRVIQNISVMKGFLRSSGCGV
jgi:hypothetical protein